LLAMPFAVVIWCIGWSLYWIGDRKKKLKPDLSNLKENVTLTVLLPENRIDAPAKANKIAGLSGRIQKDLEPNVNQESLLHQ